jgi:hypothetical protein
MILCGYWDLSLEYKNRIEEFVRKVEWDDEEDVRVLAISIAGRLLAKHDDRVLLKLLIYVFRDPSEGQLIRETAYCALGEAAGKTLRSCPLHLGTSIWSAI